MSTEPTTERPALTITEAAAACQVDRRTIRRRLDANDLPHAWREQTPQGPGPWRIPVEDLIAAGYKLHAPTPPETPETPQGRHTVTSTPTPTSTAEVEQLRAEVADLRRRAEVAEAIATERAAALEDARLALRALTAGTPAPPTPMLPTQDSTPEPARRRWWHR